MKKKLYTWEWSIFGCDTAFFYFKETKKKLLMVEYWADVDRIADFAQYYTLDGEPIEDEGRDLTDEEKKYYRDFCKAIIKKQK